MAVNIFFKTNAADTVKDLDKVEKKLQSVQKESSIKQGIARLQGQIKDGPLGGTPIGGALTDMAGKLGSVSKLLNPWAAAIAACTGAVTALQRYAKAAVENGMNAANQAETINAQLGGQLAANGVYNTQPITERLMKMAENGVSPVEKLTSAFVKLVPVMQGNAAAALDWVERMADAEAATGLSADQLTTAVMQITTQGKIEEEVAKKLPFW